MATGEVTWNLGHTLTAIDWVGYLRRVVEGYPKLQKCYWVVDNLNTHWHLEVCRQVALWKGIDLDERTLATGTQKKEYPSAPSYRHVCRFRQSTDPGSTRWS